MAEITVTVEVECNECGTKLEAEFYGLDYLYVDPCKQCLEDARDEGRAEAERKENE